MKTRTRYPGPHPRRRAIPPDRGRTRGGQRRARHEPRGRVTNRLLPTVRFDLRPLRSDPSRIREEVFAESGEWITESGAIGSPAVVHPNLVWYARSFAKYVDVLAPLRDACGCDPRLRELWRQRFIQSFADASEASII